MYISQRKNYYTSVVTMNVHISNEMAKVQRVCDTIAKILTPFNRY